MAKPPKSRLARVARLGAMSGRVGASYMGRRLKGVLEGSELKEKALKRLHVENAEKVVETVGRLKGAAMKVGQSVAVIASTLDLPEDVQAVLGKLHNDVEPLPFSDIKEDVERSLERSLDDAFAWFSPEPLGTASLAQAHAARLKDGTEVVVKVLHRGIETSVGADVGALKAALVGARLLRRPKDETDAIFEEIKERLTEELDYFQEAANIAEFRRLFADDEHLRIPRVHPSHSTDRVLTLDHLPGVPIQEFVRTASLEARQRAGRTIGELYYRMVFQHRTLHADPHPGNYLFEPDGTVGLLDFGCVKRFDPWWVADYARTALAAMDDDREACMDGCRSCGVLIDDDVQSVDALWRYCETLIAPFREGRFEAGGPSDDLALPLLESFRPLLASRSVRFERTLVYLHRALGGNYALLTQLRAEEDWGALLRAYAEHSIRMSQGEAPEGSAPPVLPPRSVGRQHEHATDA
jgi:predicted unusual protein kinase regulating ubiquinone biosynthesis (AarF/ABC1/UbiB family)